MRRVISSIFVLFLLGFFTVASAQLPPEIMVDKYMIHTEQLYAAENYAGAFKEMEKIIGLQKEHSFTLPDEFHFKYARVAFLADSIKIALDSVNKYLSATGKEGKFYKEALALLLKAEADVIITPGKTCSGKPNGAKCWQELANHPECYVWTNSFDADYFVTWTGKCSGNLLHGNGTLAWYSIYKDEDGKQKQRKSNEYTGHFQKGQKHGHGVHDWGGKNVDEGPYVEGKRHGQWVERRSYESEEGPYSASKEGPYVEGKRHGQWVERRSDGSEEGPYVEGKKHGQWVERRSNGVVDEGPYVEGKRHGQWVFSRSNGTVGSYVEYKKHGQWVERSYGSSYESKAKGEYIHGEREGIWLVYDKDMYSQERCMSHEYHQGKRVKWKNVNKKICRGW